MKRATALAGIVALVAMIPSAQAELIQKDGVRVAVSGGLAPTRLPRNGTAPITVKIGGQISSTKKGALPQLKSVSFAFNKGGKLDLSGPKCRIGRIDPSTTQEALLACRPALVGEGHFSADVRFPEQSPFPSEGKVLAFNGVLRGKPVIFAHIYGTEPVPTSYVLPLEVHHAGGTFPTRLDASLPQATGKWGFVTGLQLTLGHTFTAHGRTRSFLSAGCPAPDGFPGALFPLVRTSFSFVGQKTLTTTLNRSCKVKD
jgi:hypothetical protein